MKCNSFSIVKHYQLNSSETTIYNFKFVVSLIAYQRIDFVTCSKISQRIISDSMIYKL